MREDGEDGEDGEMDEMGRREGREQGEERRGWSLRISVRTEKDQRVGDGFEHGGDPALERLAYLL